MVRDPVCGALVDEREATARNAYQGRTYAFCSPFCQLQFEQDLARDVAQGAPAPPMRRRRVEPDRDDAAGP